MKENHTIITRKIELKASYDYDLETATPEEIKKSKGLFWNRVREIDKWLY